MRNETEYQQIHQALEEATSGLRENPFLYERVKTRIKEGETVVKKKISLGLILVLALTAITLTAFAASLLFGQEWYLSSRNGLVDAAPEKYAAIKSHLTAPVEQSNTEHSLVNMTVQDVAWVPEQKVMTASVRATLKDAEKYELFPLRDLDADGSYVGGEKPEVPDEDSEDRAVHWLWRHDADSNAAPRHGFPADMMDDPDKTLLLIEADGIHFRDSAMLYSSDEMRLSDGSCLFYYEFSLDRFDRSADKSGQDEAVLAVTYTMPYRVVAYKDSISDEELYLGGETGTFSFTVITK